MAGLREKLRPIVFKAAQRLRIVNYWLIAQTALLLLRTLRLLPADRALNAVDRIARRVGPWFGRHRVALANLRAAYPEKTDVEIEAIALDMWGNMARLGAEYVFMEKLFDYVPGSTAPMRVEIAGEDIFNRLRDEEGDRPHIFFTGHVGNFELLPIACNTHGLQLTALFRAPNNPFLAAEVMSKRSMTMGEMLASRRGVAFALARVLERGGNIGVLVDQKFHRGIKTTFFGRPCETSPLLGKLARQYEPAVHPARCIRLPGNRFRLEICERIELPRTENGAIDVARTAQMLNDVVEGWVREYPGQWMWFHKRWTMIG